MLINLSNHPYDTWGEEQKVAAAVYGTVTDVLFPVVDEAADETYISSLAESYCSRISQMALPDEATVHLMGELTFTFALLKRLQQSGYTCIAATSQRLVSVNEQGDKLVHFRFCRFRKYV